MLRHRLFNIALLQLFILGMKMATTVNLANQIIRTLGKSDEQRGDSVRDEDDEVTNLWKLSCRFLDHTFLLCSILCLLFGTKDDNEAAAAYKYFLLQFWMLLAGIYNWTFCIATAIVVDWVSWSIDDFDLGQLTFVLLNTIIFLFVAGYKKRIELTIGKAIGKGKGRDNSENLNQIVVKKTPTLPQKNKPIPTVIDLWVSG